MFRWIVLLCLLFVVPVNAQDVPRFEQIRCSGPMPRGVDVVCGFLIVPEDRTDPDTRNIALAVVIIRSNGTEPDPVVNLAGGPGGITVPALSFTFRENYRAFLEDRDFIMFDQRGVGFSQPSLDCPNVYFANYDIAAQNLSAEEIAEANNEAMFACLETLQADGVDVPAYNTTENAADLNDLREALGYDEWNLFGVSYGTKLALVTMRDYPEGLRSVILDSAYPLQVDLYSSVPQNQRRAFDLLFATCANDAICSEAYPTLEDDFYTLVERLNAEPYLVEGQHRFSGVEFRAYVTGDMIADRVFSMLYQKPQIRLIPVLIDTLYKEDYTVLPAIAQEILDRPNNISEGFYYTVQCGEEVGFWDFDAVLAAGDVFLPDWHKVQMNELDALCSSWDSRLPQATDNQPVISDIPTLILAGEFDPITPPAWGELVQDDLSNSYFYSLPNVGHGVVRSDDCGLDIALQFVDDPMTEPDASCIDDIAPIEFAVRP